MTALKELRDTEITALKELLDTEIKAMYYKIYDGLLNINHRTT